MLNPDGVILGNYRTGCAGKDLNRRFIETDPVLFPTVFALKALVKELHTEYGKNFFAFLDLHGHSGMSHLIKSQKECILLRPGVSCLEP